LVSGKSSIFLFDLVLNIWVSEAFKRSVLFPLFVNEKDSYHSVLYWQEVLCAAKSITMLSDLSETRSTTIAKQFLLYVNNILGGIG